MERRIRLHGVEEVKRFVQASERCDFDIDVSYNRIAVDGKSFLGIMGMDLARVLNVSYHGHNLEFEQMLTDFAAGDSTAA